MSKLSVERPQNGAAIAATLEVAANNKCHIVIAEKGKLVVMGEGFAPSEDQVAIPRRVTYDNSGRHSREQSLVRRTQQPTGVLYQNRMISGDRKETEGSPREAEAARSHVDGGDEVSTPSRINYTASLYSKLSSAFYGFKGFMFSNCQVTGEIMHNSEPTPSQMEAVCAPGISFTKRFYDTMDNIWRRGHHKDRFVAFIPNIQSAVNGLNLGNAFVPEHDNFVDCFALFIEDNDAPEAKTATFSRTSSLDSMGSNVTCKIISKVSHQVLSESGPYQCVFEEDIDPATQNGTFRGFMDDMVVNSGRLRFFQAMKSLGKYKDSLSRRLSPSNTTHRVDSQEDVNADTIAPSSPQNAGGIKQRLGMLGEYLMRRSEESINSHSSDNSTNASGSSGGAGSNARVFKSYFQALRLKKNEDEDGVQCASTLDDDDDDNARHRLEEHVLLHTGHWDEFQYDNIEIVLRDDNNNSIVQLPYSCAVM